MTAAEVFGDPDGMRALAQEVLARSELVAQTPAGFAAALDGADFEGGAAVRLRAAAVDARARVAGVAGELRDVAAALYADAAEVERRNAEAAAAAAATGSQAFIAPADGEPQA